MRTEQKRTAAYKETCRFEQRAQISGRLGVDDTVLTARDFTVTTKSRHFSIRFSYAISERTGRIYQTENLVLHNVS